MRTVHALVWWRELRVASELVIVVVSANFLKFKFSFVSNSTLVECAYFTLNRFFIILVHKNTCEECCPVFEYCP